MGATAALKKSAIWTLLVTSGVSCSGPSPPAALVDGGSGHARSGTTGVSPLAAELLDAPTQELLAKATAEHVPTAEEVKLIAAYWAGAIVTMADGAMPDEFMEADLPGAVGAMAALYPSFFSASGPRTSALSAAGGAGASVACGASCLTHEVKAEAAQALTGCFGVIGKYRTIAKLTGQTVSKARTIWRAFSDGYNAVAEPFESIQLGTDLAMGVWKRIEEGASYDLVKAVVDVSVLGATAAAATAGAEAAAIVAIVAANVAILECGLDVGMLIQEVKMCRARQLSSCADAGADAASPADVASPDPGGFDGGADTSSEGGDASVSDAMDAGDAAASTATGSVTHVGRSKYTFAAQAGNGIMVRVVDAGDTSFAPAFALISPSGQQLVVASGPDVAAAEVAQAPVDGTYTLDIYDAGPATSAGGAFDVFVVVAPGTDDHGTLQAADVRHGHLDKGALHSYTFRPQVGESISIRATDVGGGGLVPTIAIYGPDGKKVDNHSGPDVAWTLLSPDIGGTYTVVIYDSSVGHAMTGDYVLYFAEAPGAAKDGALSAAAVVTGHVDEGEIDSYTFKANAGDTLTLRVTDPAEEPLVPVAALYAPGGRKIGGGAGSRFAPVQVNASTSGTYTLLVYDESVGNAASGDYRLYLAVVPGAGRNGALGSGGRVDGKLDVGALDSYTLSLSLRDKVQLTLATAAGATLTPAFLVFDPLGRELSRAVGPTPSAELTVSTAGTFTVIVYDNSGTGTQAGDTRFRRPSRHQPNSAAGRRARVRRAGASQSQHATGMAKVQVFWTKIPAALCQTVPWPPPVNAPHPLLAAPVPLVLVTVSMAQPSAGDMPAERLR
jgi:hypothetical protein